jgi:hypothetical protein
MGIAPTCRKFITLLVVSHLFAVLVSIRWMGENPLKCTHYEKKKVLQLALQFNFWIAKDICNSLYLHTASANKQVAWIAK